jgi:hypothetical protein
LFIEYSPLLISNKPESWWLVNKGNCALIEQAIKNRRSLKVTIKNRIQGRRIVVFAQHALPGFHEKRIEVSAAGWEVCYRVPAWGVRRRRCRKNPSWGLLNEHIQRSS